ncbi:MULTISPECIES: hypothetical protein [unclassified Streptomyces]|uniref:hypothetical protein n=1 Tax=unclassified Streptomyces TaxID=2593676 RepID=UPI002251E22D|nr:MULTISPECIES: hypothetical protein [unclassified Streptomyces]MCX4526911.1 hypothetical protein [Streptomyces sp. NBC_01551]MCX4542529.1 hypothetical protein [Streptomyces sp. NBC_01565]
MTRRPRAPHWLAGAVLAAAVLAPATACAVAPGAPGRIALTPLTPFGTAAFAPASRAAAPDDAGPLGDVPDTAHGGLAGTLAGAGRERPGRPAAEPANPETLLASRPLRLRPLQEPAEPPAARPVAPSPPGRPNPPSVSKPSSPPDPPRPQTPPGVSQEPSRPAAALGTEPNDRAADLAAHMLPLGTGFALMGLGLGFMGMRLRRGP